MGLGTQTHSEKNAQKIMSTRTERLTTELVLRYACATLVTLIAAAGAQLVIRGDFVLAVSTLSIVGAWVSLYLRVHGMRVAGVLIPRPLWNGLTSLAWLLAATLWTISSLSDIMAILLNGGGSQAFWVRFGAGDSLLLLMQVFLLFSAFRSFALISDKDATLATVPSFSVLLLLIPVHKGIEVVLYFLAWTLSATALFALDHRSELARAVDGRVPAAVPGQDVRLAARGLATVMASALVAAFALSYFLTSRDADSRSSTENAITGLAGRLAQFALQSSSDQSGSAGPERQIDFSSGPTLPSKTLLWKALVFALNGQSLRPQYFRLFTLERYNGSTWLQAGERQKQKRVVLAPVAPGQWPTINAFSFQGSGSFRGGPFIGGSYGGRQLRGGRFSGGPFGGQSDRPPADAFAVGAAFPNTTRSFGTQRHTVRMSVTASATNLGFVPLLPGTRLVSLVVPGVQELRARSDGALDLSFIPLGQRVRGVAELPDVPEYGGRDDAPTQKVAASPSSPRLSPDDRATYVEHPALSARVNQFARAALSGVKPGYSNLNRAQRLAHAIQVGATYTLRPPTLPEGKEATDYFLFDGKKRGFCTHFASALTVLCRSQGIPARVVSGFAVKEYDSDGLALLRDDNAHAWTEVWVDNWGWATVDATPAGDRGDNAPNWLSLWGEWATSLFLQVEGWSRARILGLGLGTVALLLGVYVFGRRVRVLAWWARRHRLNRETEWSRREIEVAYGRASSELARRFRPRLESETPDEWLDAAAHFAAQAPRPVELPLRQLRQLTGLYLYARYAPQAPDKSLVIVARELAGHLTWKKPRSKNAALDAGQ